MKADITNEGNLIIKSESGMESFALKKWWENYLKGDLISTLQIDFESRRES